MPPKLGQLYGPFYNGLIGQQIDDQDDRSINGGLSLESIGFPFLSPEFPNFGGLTHSGCFRYTKLTCLG